LPVPRIYLEEIGRRLAGKSRRDINYESKFQALHACYPKLSSVYVSLLRVSTSSFRPPISAFFYFLISIL